MLFSLTHWLFLFTSLLQRRKCIYLEGTAAKSSSLHSFPPSLSVCVLWSITARCIKVLWREAREHEGSWWPNIGRDCSTTAHPSLDFSNRHRHAPLPEGTCSTVGMHMPPCWLLPHSLCFAWLWLVFVSGVAARGVRFGTCCRGCLLGEHMAVDCYYSARGNRAWQALSFQSKFLFYSSVYVCILPSFSCSAPP